MTSSRHLTLVCDPEATLYQTELSPDDIVKIGDIVYKAIGDINKKRRLTQKVISATQRAVGRRQINDDKEAIPARFAGGTRARIDAVLEPKEPVAQFIRVAVEAEIKRREREAKRKS